MGSRSPLLALTLVAALGCSHPQTGPVPASTADAMRKEILQDMVESAAAWNRGDLDGHVSLYTDSAAMMGRNGPIPGRGTIRGILERGFWTGGKPSQQLSFSDLVVTPLGAEHAMLTGKCTLTGGGKADFTCRFTTIWEKRSNGWRIIHDHSS
jgi:ketosteroid isomerase-like protein